jgi:hypothetical protein
LGPCFTGEISSFELSAHHEPFNGNKKCKSDAKKGGYGIPVNAAGLNMLTN